VLAAALEQCDVLAAHWTELEAICGIAPWTINHGDFAIKNLRVRPGAGGPGLLVYDWEYAGCGVPNIDLAQFIGGVASPDLGIYRSALDGWTAITDVAQVQQLATCGGFFRLLEAMHWASVGLTQAETIYLAEPVSELRSYVRRMAPLLHETGWVTQEERVALQSTSARVEAALAVVRAVAG
jgi:aminoglycoside phosphotransferase (APT) family kinase protein